MSCQDALPAAASPPMGSQTRPMRPTRAMPAAARLWRGVPPWSCTTAAAAMAQGKSDEEVALLAAIFTQLGDSLAMIVALRACEKSGGSEAE